MTFREAASVIANPEGRGDHRAGDLTTAREGAGIPRSGDEQCARRQVLIEATIVEVTLFDGYRQGIEVESLD
jgi:hypothetical protein